MNEPLRRLTLTQLLALIRSENSQLAEQTRVVEEAYELDVQAGRRQEAQLPCVVPALFHPPYLREDNFIRAWGIFVELVITGEHQPSPGELKGMISVDEHVMLAFTGASGNAVYVFMRFSEPINNPALYASLYKTFVPVWAASRQLEHMVTLRLASITTPCFLAHDPEPVANLSAATVEPFRYIDPSTYQPREHWRRRSLEILPRLHIQKTATSPLPTDALSKIKELLKDTEQVRHPARKFYVPEPLRSAMPFLLTKFKETDIEVVSERDIHYGKQIQVRFEGQLAEVNIFWGKKKGFTAVPTTRTGTNHELSRLVAQLILQWLAQLPPQT